MATVFATLAPLAVLSWDYDAPTPYLLRVARRRMWAGAGSPLPAGAAGAVDALGPATVADLDERAKAMDADEAVTLAPDALERYLAAIGPPLERRITAGQALAAGLLATSTSAMSVLVG